MSGSAFSTISTGGGGAMSLTLLPDSEKLETKNWIKWKRTMTSILCMKGLMVYAEGTVRPPSKIIPQPTSITASLPVTTMATPATPTPIAPSATTSQITTTASNPFLHVQGQPQQASSQSTGGIFGLTPSHGSLQAKPLPRPPIQDDEWRRLDASAAAHILLNIKSEAILSKFRSGTPAHEIWSSLCARFERTNGALALQARNRLAACKYADGHDIQSHIDDMSKLWEAALAVGVKIEDEEFCHILRSSFPPSWALLLTTLITVNDPAALESSLLAFADFGGPHSSKPVQSTSSTALLSSSIVIQCTNCGKKNHTSDRCYQKGGGAEHSAPRWWRERQRLAQDKHSAKIATNDDGTRAPVPSVTAFTATHTQQSPYNPFRRTDPTGPTTAYATSDFHLFVASVGSRLGPGQRITTYADSGASHHYFVDRSDFDTYMEISPVTGQGAGKDSTFQIVGIGSVQKDVVVDGRRQRVTFANAVHAPSLAANLISISRLDAEGVFIRVGNGAMVFTDGKGQPFMRGISTSGNLYELDLLPCAESDTPPIALLSTSGAADAATWHRRLGHIGDSGLQRLVSRKLVDGLDIKGPASCSTLCLDCVYGKHARRPFTQWIKPETEPLERVYIDLWGPAQVDSIGGHRYYMSVDDGGSSWCQPFFIPDKEADTTLSAFKHFKRQAESVTGRRLKAVRTDQGSEFKNAKWEEFCAAEGIIHEFTAPYTHQQVGVAERSHRTIVERARCMLKDAGLPGEFWAEAVSTACHLKNVTASHRHPDRTPHEIWTGRRPDVAYLRPFGCAAYMWVPDETRRKLDPKSLACVLLGYFPGRMYRLWDPVGRRVHQSRDVIFDEGSCHRTRRVEGEWGVSTAPNMSADPIDPTDSVDSSTVAVPADSANPAAPSDTLTPPSSPSFSSSGDTTEPIPLDTGRPVTRRSTRIRNPSRRQRETNEYLQREGAANRAGDTWATDMSRELDLEVSSALVAAVREDLAVPRTYSEAMKHPEIWLPSMRKEMDKMAENEVWELVRPPPGANIVDSKWHYAPKFDSEGEIVSHKSRLVAKGFTQVYGVDYFETFASVVRFDSLRLILAIAVSFDLELWQVDFESAFLNGRMKEEVYMRQPEGFVVKGKEDHVCRLLRSLYGTMQAGHTWWHELDRTYADLGYTRSRVDESVRSRRIGEEMTLLSTYTDDVTGASTSAAGAAKAKQELQNKYKLKDGGELNYMLGIKVERDRANKTISISQSAYITRILNRFRHEDCAPASTPLPPGTKLSDINSPDNDTEKLEMSNLPYRELLGSLMYLYIGTRPDLSFAIQCHELK